MCFRITLRKDMKGDAEYLGDDWSSIEEDKKIMQRNSSNFYNEEGDQVLYKILVSTPEISETDDIIQNYHILQNPTNRKSTDGATVYPAGVKSKRLKRIIQKASKALR
jgi:hypothetical protein